MRIQVKDFMSVPVVTAVPTAEIAYIQELMEHKNVHSIPIVEHDGHTTIRGIVTATDLKRVSEKHFYAEEIMTRRVYVVHKDSSAQAAAQMMVRNNVHHLVVMEEDRIVGMLSALDFVRLVAEHDLE